MWMMFQRDAPEDFVVETGETHTVREMAARDFRHVGLSWRPFAEIDPAYYRPTEVEHLHADSKRVFEELGWKPEVGFGDFVTEMVESDLVAHDFATIDEARARVAERFDDARRQDPDGGLDLAEEQ